ncbi:RNA polymerase factor sigma-54 [Planctomycetota bacterium]
MKLEMRGQMRLEQQMKLAPHMIQSMEILQLPLLALAERIEQELNSNPVLELDEPTSDESTPENEQDQEEISETATGESEVETGEDFRNLDSLDGDYEEYINQSGPFRRRKAGDEPDRKLEAIKNTAAPSQSLHEYLSDQWRMVDAEEAIKKAGNMIIDYIDDKGYLSVRLEQLHNKDRVDFTFEQLQDALKLVQKLEPIGVGARDLRECLLIQMSQSTEDMSFEMRLIGEYMDELLANHLPAIAHKMDCDIETINHAIEKMSRLDTSPGLQVGQSRNHPVTADIIVETAGDSGELTIRLSDSNLPGLKVSSYYAKISRASETNAKTKRFLQDNIRSARWIIDAIEQRKSTLLKVARAVVRFQREFFEKGPLHLHPLPMSKVADEVGVHLATVSRAVAGKYIQCSWGVLPLRKFFSGGLEEENGKGHSWDAIRAKLQKIIAQEDKSKPLNDDMIRDKLIEEGIERLARRTVAKYRKLLNIPPARLRKKYKK